ncbi:MAG TPA: hypothetical protein DEH78_08070 [Solibacterales bacterium]|nr:hypothetical protein [Bryobacterales bacterium]
MFDPTSRYASIEDARMTVKDKHGRERVLVYKRRRFLPPAGGATLLEHTFTQGERLDVITARYLGDPTQFWRIADANEVLRAEELTLVVGRRMKIPVPGVS